MPLSKHLPVLQFCISPPKTDMENTVVVNDYAKMDKILREERNYILQTIKKIKASGCNVLLIQKSILRDAVTDLSLHYLVRFHDCPGLRLDLTCTSPTDPLSHAGQSQNYGDS